MRSFISLLLMSVVAASAWAAPIDEARRLYEKGEYSQAITRLKTILKRAPRNATANYYLGMCYLRTRQPDKAREALQQAEDKGSRGAALELASLCYGDYEFDAAGDHLETLEKLVKKERKDMPVEADNLRSQILKAKNMLQRVEKIEVIDSINVDRDDFFKYYKLSASAGNLLPGTVLGPKYAETEPSVVFQPQSAREVFWGAANDDGAVNIVSAQILDDGSLEEPKPMSDNLAEGGDADYMYMMPDGTTFYFANDGENSLGGYDIFMSRRMPDGTVLDPQNVGMPYNSTSDDYMLVIDEDAGLGWWATDRNHLAGQVTIYVFVPNPTRVNYDPDDDMLRQYALLTDISLTQSGDIDAEQLLNRPMLRGQAEAEEPSDEFGLVLLGGQVYTSLSQFRNAQARQAMQQFLARSNDLEIMKARLSAMRQRYAQGDHSVSDEILTLEKRVLAAKPILKRLRNQAIQWEAGML